MDMRNILKLNEIIKAKVMENTNNIIIIPHTHIDFDAFASAIGIATLAKKIRQSPNIYIIIDDSMKEISTKLKMIIEELSTEYNIINSAYYDTIANKEDLFILTDVNKPYRIGEISNYLTNSEQIIIIDHHKKDDSSVVADYELIDTKISSASEIVTNILNINNIEIAPNVAKYLLAGIMLDTDHLLNPSTKPETMMISSQLLTISGGNISNINELFEESLQERQQVNSFLNNLETCTLCFIIATNGDMKCDQIAAARAADIIAKLKGVDAAFCITTIDNDAYISARTTRGVDVGSLMEKLGGGGDNDRGAAIIKNTPSSEATKVLKRTLVSPYGKIITDKKI